MGLKDIFNKGMEYINKGTSTVAQAARDKRDAINNYNLLITTSERLQGLKQYEIKNQTPSGGREQTILATCLTINVEKARLINSLIPVDETILNVRAATESKTQMNYLVALTDKGIWVLNQNEYAFYEYGSIANFEIINKSLMSQGVKFDNKAFIFEGSEGEIQKFGSTIMDSNFRNGEILKETAYLGGVIPKLQITTINYAGVTIGEDNRIVLHNGKDKNKVVNLQDIDCIQLLMDNAVVMTRGKNLQAHMSATQPCRKMTLRFTMKNEPFEIEIMPQNIMGSLVKVEDALYQNSFGFARRIMDTIMSMM